MLRLLLSVLLAGSISTGTALAQDTAAQSVVVELNKLENGGDICRAYFIVRNGSSGTLDALELDTFLFDTDGIILQRLALPFGAVSGTKMRIVSFDFELPCDAIGSLFVNDIIRCEAAGAPCADSVATTSRAEQPFEF